MYKCYSNCISVVLYTYKCIDVTLIVSLLYYIYTQMYKCYSNSISIVLYTYKCIDVTLIVSLLYHIYKCIDVAPLEPNSSYSNNCAANTHKWINQSASKKRVPSSSLFLLQRAGGHDMPLALKRKLFTTAMYIYHFSQFIKKNMQAFCRFFKKSI